MPWMMSRLVEMYLLVTYLVKIIIVAMLTYVVAGKMVQVPLVTSVLPFGTLAGRHLSFRRTGAVCRVTPGGLGTSSRTLVTQRGPSLC